MKPRPEDVFREYVSALERSDVGRLAEHYNLPSLFVGTAGVVLISDEASRRAITLSIVKQAQDEDYVRTDFPVLDVRQLGEDLAQVSGVGVRVGRSGAEIRRFGFTHTMRFDSAAWRFVMVTGYDTAAGDDVPTLS